MNRISLSGIDRGAWIRFFIALAGLALAFAAALFSSIARESGNVLATAVLASLALVLAGVVAVTVVPYLARRVAFARVRDALDYDVTREGLVYSLFVLVIGIAALNTGNNLLFIVVSAMLAAIVVSGVASAGVLRGLDLDVSVPAHVFAGSTALARLTLHNRRRRTPSFSVSVVPPRPKAAGKRWRWERSSITLPLNAAPGREWFRVPDLQLRVKREAASAPAIFSTAVYFPYIAARGAATADVELRFDRRGRYRQGSFGIATRFPFSFLVKTRRIALEREIIAYPSIGPTDEMFEILPLITGEFEAFMRGRGHDLYRIREYMPEDSARHVDWKATAKSMSLMVREFTREDERKLRIVFDNPAPGLVPEAEYEKAVALAASLGWHFAGEPTDLSFAAPGYDGAGDIYDFLRYLALVEPRAGESALEHLEVTDDYNVILTARPRGSIPTRLWACSYFIFMNQ
ncbi:MAG TPA: DUF58 domain-containing protein [Terriglobales bacterium]|jgi:uncharacterized protein (DUF58 family)|nr:DUF58 domain-containing protein [Terriglobales bacterium]